MNKTLNQVITDKTEAVVFSTILDEATQAEVKDQFLDRYVCCEDEDRFIRLFQRNMRRYVKQYNEYLRIENIEFDPMITRYLEREVVNKVNTTESGTISGSTTGTKLTTNGGNTTIKTDNEVTGNGHSNTQESGTLNSTTSGAESGTSNENKNYSDRTRDLLSVFPQANVQPATSGSLDDPVSYTYATQMNDKLSKGNSTDAITNSKNSNGSENSRSSNTGNTTTSNSEVLDGTQTVTIATNTNIQNNSTDNKTTSATGTEDGKLRERFTGRENYDTATLLGHARDYVAQTNALRWLVDKLEICFIGNLRYGEE